MQRGGSGDRACLLLLLAGTLALTLSLHNGRLWQDEAETAVLGKNILAYGYPSAFDGVNLLNPSLPTQKGYAWTYHSWLSMYVAAASFWFLGTSTLTARLPFACMGIAALWLVYRLTRRMMGDRRLARWTLFFGVTSVPFLLHMRQCRYYAPTVLATLWVVWAWQRFLLKRRTAGVELFVALQFLFHSDHGVFLPVLGALLVHFFLHPNRQVHGYRLAALGVAIAATTVPWMIYLEAWQHRQAFSWLEAKHHLEFYFRQINRFVFPIFFWAIGAVLFRPPWRILLGKPGSRRRSSWILVGLLLMVGIGFIILLPQQRHFRYLLFLIPFLWMVQAALLVWILERRRLLGMGLALLLVFTDFVHYSGPGIVAAQIPPIRKQLSTPDAKIRSLPLELIGELIHPYRGPIDGIVELLLAQGKMGQTLKTPYEEHPILFYTKMKVEPLVRGEEFGRETFPDWIILRRDWLPAGFSESAYYERIRREYQPILVMAPDLPWQNRPDPGYHRFRTDWTAPHVMVFRKRGGAG